MHIWVRVMLRLTELSAGYGAFTAVHGLSLDVAPASVFALVGANGAAAGESRWRPRAGACSAI